VLLDSLRCLAARGLTTPDLFSSPVNKRQLLALKEAYDAGRRALRSARVATNIEPAAAANLLLLWLGALPEPLFPAEHVPELLQSHTNPNATRAERVASMRCLLKRTEPFIVEALFPLFELLHHYWINQPHREATLESLASTFAIPVFGTPAEHGACPETAMYLQDAAALLITEYRPLFTQPYNLQRYEADLARQANAAEAKAIAAETRAAQESINNSITLGANGACTSTTSRLSPLRVCSSSSPIMNGNGTPDWAELGSPLLTPRRMGALSVMEPIESLSLLGCSPDENSSLWSLCLSSTSSSLSPINCNINGNGTITATSTTQEEMEMLLDNMLESTVAAAFGVTPTPTPTAGIAMPSQYVGSGCHHVSSEEDVEHKHSPVSIFLGGSSSITSGVEGCSRETSTDASASPCDMLSDSSDCDTDLPQAQALVAAAAMACAQLPGAAATC
jgi:RhoGAP domain